MLFPAQQDDDGTRSARVARRLAIREHVVEMREPAPHLALQNGLAVRRRKSLAVNDPRAALAAGPGVEEKVDERVVRFVRRHAVEIELRLDHPAAAPQPAQYVAAEPATHECLLAVHPLPD